MPESQTPEPDQPAPPTPRDEPVPAPPSDEPAPVPRVVPREMVPREIGGRTSGLDPTRYGDWEKNGRCIDF
jgi:hypothetical protein